MNNGKGTLPGLPGNENDPNGINIMVAPDGAGNVKMEFSKPIAWLLMPNDNATTFAMQILNAAGKKIEVKYPDSVFVQIVHEVVHCLDVNGAGPRFDREKAIAKVKAMLNGE